MDEETKTAFEKTANILRSLNAYVFEVEKRTNRLAEVVNKLVAAEEVRK